MGNPFETSPGLLSSNRSEHNSSNIDPKNYNSFSAYLQALKDDQKSSSHIQDSKNGVSEVSQSITQSTNKNIQSLLDGSYVNKLGTNKLKFLASSSPPEIVGKMTYCSRTAFKNLSDMGCPDPVRGASARESFGLYKTPAYKTLPPPNNALIGDLYFDASARNKQYGHRVVAFQQEGVWKVFDPYYNLPGTIDKTAPKPLDQYIAMMRSKGRNFWGGHYFG